MTRAAASGRKPSDLAGDGRWPRRVASGREADSGAPSWPDGFAASVADREALAMLLGLPTVTPRRLLELAEAYPTATECLSAVAAGRVGSERDRAVASTVDPAEALRQLKPCGGRLVAVGDSEYPPELLDLFDPPAGIFVRGLPLEPATYRVGIVGARSCSPQGREMATSLGRALAGAGACVVSGGARGIDGAAHQGALQAGGPTAAVLGCGIDVAYPPQNKRMLESITKQGAVLSEYPPGMPAEPFRFPARNRLVAALSRAVVVVEGAPGSGSLITAEHALDLGRDVFAVPGSVHSELAAVPLALIREGAGLIRCPEDLLSDLGFGSPAGSSRTEHGDGSKFGWAGSRPPPGLSGDEAAVWVELGDSVDPGALAGRLGMPVAMVTSILVSLELRGLVVVAGGRYRRLLEGNVVEP
jgi:DNA processing protein